MDNTDAVGVADILVDGNNLQAIREVVPRDGLVVSIALAKGLIIRERVRLIAAFCTDATNVSENVIGAGAFNLVHGNVTLCIRLPFKDDRVAIGLRLKVLQRHLHRICSDDAKGENEDDGEPFHLSQYTIGGRFPYYCPPDDTRS